MKEETKTHRPCQYVKANGDPCQAYAGAHSNFCFWHDPAKAKERGEARSKGGKTTMGKPAVLSDSDFRLETLQNVVQLLEETINHVRTGALEVRIAQCTGYLAGLAIKALEQAELERRIEALEKLVNERGKR